MHIGLTFEEYVDVKLRPLVHADRAFHIAADQIASEKFPMTTIEAANHLRSRGYGCRPASLEMLVETQAVSIAEPDRWTRPDVDAAAEYFEECEAFVPYATMCQALGCRYVDFLRPLREAAERESAKYGRHIPADDQYFVMHRMPPRGGTEDEYGNVVGESPAVISFTLCDDIRQQLEAGEMV